MTEVEQAAPLAPLPSSPVRRVAFLGTPSLAAFVLERLIACGFEIAVVVTGSDKRRSRGSALLPSPVKEVALAHGLNVVDNQDELLDEHDRQPIELGIVVAYGSIVSKKVLSEIPMVNLHVSQLPRWRGAAPIERALLAGDTQTGVCLMQLEEGLDTGGVIASASMEIGDTTTAADIGRHLIEIGSDLLVDALRTGNFAVVPQQGEPIYAAKISPVERKIVWSESPEKTSRRVRIGGAWTVFRSKRVKIHSVSRADKRLTSARILVEGSRVFVGCGEDSLELLEVQPEGRPRLSATDWARGARIGPEESFDEE